MLVRWDSKLREVLRNLQSHRFSSDRERSRSQEFVGCLCTYTSMQVQEKEINVGMAILFLNGVEQSQFVRASKVLAILAEDINSGSLISNSNLWI